MDVYQTDAQGCFVGVTKADVDPLNLTEWLIPAGCVTVEPHEAPEGFQVRWDGSSWINEAVPVEPTIQEEVMDPAEDVRVGRDVLLQNSDWTQVADAPVDQATWAAYRQALRDVPNQDGFPDNIQWPVKP